MSYLYICIDTQNLTEQTKLKIEFNDTNISTITVQELKDKLTTTINNQTNNQFILPKYYDLIFFGRRLKLNNKLANYGIIRSGANLFVIENQIEKNTNDNKDDKTKKELNKKSKSEQLNMIAAIRATLFNSDFRAMLHKLYDNEFRENFVDCTPGLRDDLIAFTILQDPEMMMICTDKENLSKIKDKYSVFIEAASTLVALFHEEMIMSSSNQSNSNNSSSSIFGRENAYSLNYELDDDLTNEPPEGQQIRETQPIIQNRITVDQLQQAIEAARSSLSSSEMQAPTTSSTQLNQQSQNQQSQNQQSQNQQQNSSSSLYSLPNQSSQSTTSTSVNQPTRREFEQELVLMRELGFLNDTISVQALEASNGNVQEAINFIFLLQDGQNQ